MTDRRNARMPNGSEIVRIEGDMVHFNITIPPDDSGYFGRECPSCERINYSEELQRRARRGSADMAVSSRSLVRS